MGSNRQEQRTGSRYGDALAFDIQSTFDQGLETAWTKDSGQRPSGKGQKAFARAGSYDELTVIQAMKGWNCD
jgi:hypothetical protein